MDAVILAGGKGTRLQEKTKDLPKPLIPIGDKSVLDHQLDLLKKNGFKRVFILAGYLGEVIQRHVNQYASPDLEIIVHQEKKPLGTSGCMKEVEEALNDDFLLLYGDIMMDMNLAHLCDFHKQKQGVATTVVHPNDHPFDSDLVETDQNGKVTAFITKDRSKGYYKNQVNAALYVLSPKVLDFIPKGEKSDFVKDIFPLLLKQSLPLFAYKTAEYVKDMGTPERLQRVTDDLLSGKIAARAMGIKRPAIFLDRDGTLVEDIHLIHKPEDLKLFNFTASALKKLNQSSFLSLVVTNQPVVAKNLCDFQAVEVIHAKMETLLGNDNAYVDDIYFCPHHPDRGYPEENKNYKIDCECRKPKTGMIQKAISEYNVDVESSYMVGDTTTDIQTGLNAGLTTILLRTGKGGKDGKYEVKPDFFFEDVREAIDFIANKSSVFEQVRDRLEALLNKNGTDRKLILIGGLARSGKSTLTSYIAGELKSRGIQSKQVSLDSWIIGTDQRTSGMRVQDRFQYGKMEADLKNLLEKGERVIPKYNPWKRKQVGEEKVTLNGAEVVIIDGIPTLDFPFLRNLSDLSIYAEIDEEERKKKFFRFYKWKGMKEDEISPLYQTRLKDETVYIDQTKERADLIFNWSSYYS